MGLVITNTTGATLDIDDLGLGLAAAGQLDITLESDPLAVTTSSIAGDLFTLVTSGDLTVNDPIDDLTVMSVSDALAALRSHNDPHFRMPPGGRIADALDVDITGIGAGDMLSYNSTTSKLEPITTTTLAGLISHSALLDFGTDDHTEYTLADGSRSFTGPIENDVATIATDSNQTLTTKGYVDSIAGGGAVAAGAVLGLQQQLLAEAGQPGKTVLVAGPATNGKLQGSSLGDGNVVEVYANGTDFTSGIVLYREFMSLGEPICFTGITTGAVLTATQGFYGFTEVEGTSLTVAGQQGVMPLMSFGFAFKSTFLYAFRGSTGATNDRGIITVANGPLDNVIKLTNGSGVTTLSQENISLTPWEVTFLDTDADQEYILSGTEKMMACIFSEGGGTVGNGLTGYESGRAWDCRLIPPLTSDGIVHPRSGYMSAPYNDTSVAYYDQEGHEGTLSLVSPGAPVYINTETGNSQGDHNPAGYTRFKATGLVTAYSGADGQGGDAVAMFDVAAMSQVVAQPMPISDSGNADESSVTICSPYSGTAKIYEWNTTTLSLDLAYTVDIIRDASIVITSKEDQNHPCAAQVSNTTGNANTTALTAGLLPGVIIADVPIGVVIQNQSASNQITIRSQNGTTTTAIQSLEDETATFGWTPANLKAEITEGTDGILYKRVIGAAGTDTWVVA